MYVKQYHCTSEQSRQLISKGLRESYHPPKAADATLRVVTKEEFSSVDYNDEQLPDTLEVREWLRWVYTR